jgi:hypothetical protein
LALKILYNNKVLRIKIRTVFITLLLLGLLSTTYSQVTEAEKKLKTVNADTVMGWKKGGVFALNLAQTSLSNWAAGGQNAV